MRMIDRLAFIEFNPNRRLLFHKYTGIEVDWIERVGDSENWKV